MFNIKTIYFLDEKTFKLFNKVVFFSTNFVKQIKFLNLLPLKLYKKIDKHLFKKIVNYHFLTETAVYMTDNTFCC